MRYRFNDCVIDTGSHQFVRDGTPVRLEPQIFDLLHLLAANPGKLITRDELIEKIWAGRIVSEATISSRISAAREAAGDDGKRQSVIQTVPRRGIRFVAQVDIEADDPVEAPTDTPAPVEAIQASQKVRFCKSSDGTLLAYSVSGSGPPLMRVGHWMTHLEHDWRSPIWRPILTRLGRSFTLTRYDQRGNGLSERKVDDLSLDAFVLDFLAVADAAGLERFPVFASSQGVPVAIDFAARFPERVSAMVLMGGFAQGRLRRSPQERAGAQAYSTLMRQGWGAEGSHFLQAFASIFIPDGSSEQVNSLVELQRITADADMAVKLRSSFDDFDVTDRLPLVQAPCLLMHGRNDGVHPLSESLNMAANLPHAELMVLESRNHIPLEQVASWEECFVAISDFIARHDDA